MTRLRRPPPLTAVGLALLLAGAGTAVIGFSLAAGSTPVTPTLLRGDRANLPIDEAALHATDLSANNSPAVAADPTDPANLVVSNRIDLPAFGCGLHHSHDGGATWSPTSIPIPAGEEPKCYAPDVAFGADGTLYVSFVTLRGAGNEPNAVWLTTSPDRGRSLTAPTAISGPHAYQVRLLADPRRSGRLYLSWIQATGVGNLSFTDTGNPVTVVRSDDGGLTWGPPVAVSPPSRLRPLAPSLALGPGDAVYALYLDLGDDALDYEGKHGGQGGEPYQGHWRLVLARSTDLGATWHEGTVADDLVPSERLLVFLPPFPSLAVDGASGRIYVAFDDARTGDADVYLWVSTDSGRTFTPPRRVNDTPRRDGTAQYLPRLAVAPDGRLDVLYYDRRRDPENLRNDVSLQSSVDGGQSFTPSIRVSDRSFDSRVGFGSERNLADLGSRLALLSTDTRALAVWTDTRAGTEASGKQDLGRAVVAFSTPERTGARGLAIAGILIAVLGAAAAVWGSYRRA